MKTLRVLGAWVTFLVPFVFGAALVIRGAALVLKLSALAPVATDLSFIPPLREWVKGVERDRRHERIALLGDSKLMADPEDQAVPATTARALRALGGKAANMSVHTLAWPAASVPAEYCIADDVDAHPDLVVLEVNLHFLGPLQPATRLYSGLGALIRNARLSEAALLPLSYTGLTLNRLLFYALLDRVGARDAWATLAEWQARLFKVREPLEAAVEARAARITGHDDYTDRRWAGMVGISARTLVPGTRRFNRVEIEKSFGTALQSVEPTHPRLRILRALLETYRRAGIRVLVWVPPLNVEHIRSLGLPTDGLDRTIRVIQRLVVASGASLFDTHALLPDPAFRDFSDHFTTDGDATAIVGDALARAIVDAAPPFTPPPPRPRRRARPRAAQP